MKKTTLLLLFSLVAIFAWAGNNREQKSTERNQALWMIDNINDLCSHLANDIKTYEAADSLNEVVWEHRDNLDKLSKENLEQFVNKLISIKFFPTANLTATNPASWKDTACKEVAVNTNLYIFIQNTITKIYDDIYWKKQRIFDTFITITEYSKEPAETNTETVKRLLDTPEVRSFIGKQNIFYINALKVCLEVLKKLNSKNKELMQVTDDELSKMFDSIQTVEFSYPNDIESIIE